MILLFLLRNLAHILAAVALIILLILAGVASGSLQYYFWALLVLGLLFWMLRAKYSERRGR
jgi:hypothetical protein